MNYIAELEKYPHVIKKLDELWGTQEGRTMLDMLTLVEKSRNREVGFTVDAFLEIMFLQRIHDQMYPQFEPTKIYDHNQKESSWNLERRKSDPTIWDAPRFPVPEVEIEKILSRSDVKLTLKD